jgi:hypothetical protein
MALRLATPSYTALAVPVDLEHLQHYVAALAARVPVLLDAHAADQQMVLHLIDEQIVYLHARSRHMPLSGPHAGEHTQQWCVLRFHLEALQKLLSAHTSSGATLPCNPPCSCNLPYNSALARFHTLDIYIPLEPTT